MAKTGSNSLLAPSETNENCDIVSQFSRDFYIDKDKIAALTDDEVVKRYLVAKQIGTAAREVRIAFFTDMQRRFKNYTKKRDGIPTLECAFEDYGMNYDTERQAVYRERQRIKEDANQLLPKRDEAKYPQFADGAEAVVKDNGHFVTVVHDNVTTNDVLTDEIVEGDVPVRREYKRVDLCSIAEYLAQADKKSKKQQRLDDEAADNAYYADRYFDLLGILLNAPQDATAEDIIGKMKAEAELAHQSLTGEQAKRIKVPHFPKRKGPTIDDARKTILKLKGEIKVLKSKVPKTKQPTVKTAEPPFNEGKIAEYKSDNSAAA